MERMLQKLEKTCSSAGNLFAGVYASKQAN